MEFRQVSVNVGRADANRAEALLNLAEPLALSFDDAADSPLFEPEPGTTPLWPELVIHALFPADFDVDSLVAVLHSAMPTIASITTRGIDAADWRAGLEQTVFVLRVTDDLWVVPAGWDEQPPARHVVQLHMGLAFGTGRHPTTLLCLEWLAAHPPRGLTVCDFGCGSGVLAIAALKLGARRAIAIDNDPQAVTATRANARLNGVAAAVATGTGEDFPQTGVDLVLANILAGTLSESVERIAAMLRPGGRIVLSGVLGRQAPDVERAFAERFADFRTTHRDGWARIAAILR